MHRRRHDTLRRVLGLSGRSRGRTAIAGLLTVLTVLGLTFVATAASAAPPVYQITGQWAPGTPTTVRSGDVVTGVWRINVNDSANPPANDPVSNVNFKVTLTNGVFKALPDACRTSGVTPTSSISADGKTLVCNVGTHKEGSALVMQAPVVADGPTGSKVSATGTIADQTADLSPIDIVNPFGMDMRWGTGTPNFTRGSNYYDMDFEWTLSKNLGSDPGPQTISYDVNISSPQGVPIQVGPNQCTPFTANPANGHPWSGGSHPADQMDSFPSTCTITQTGANTFRLTLSGINYNPSSPPALDSTGARLPTDQVALASGSIWIRVTTSAGGSAQVSSNAPTYTSTTGQTAQDDPSNNTESKAWTTPGLYSSGWGRGYTGSGGTTWDDTYKVAAGTEVGQYMDTDAQLHGELPDNWPVGMCTKLDTKYATFVTFTWGANPTGGVNGAVVEYYTGSDPHLDPASGSYDPNTFDCNVAGGWSTTPPSDPALVKAVRVTMTEAQARVYSQGHITPVVYQTVKPSTPAGTDVWSFMSAQVAGDGSWYNRSDVCITPVPGGRYPCTTGFADVLHVVTAVPAIRKSVDRTVVTPGVPATYTLTYAADGAGAIPSSVDGLRVVDTLPAHMTYVPGSATPAPTITTNGSGQQVLTWTIDGVTTNTDHPLTYQAVADTSATPGSALTNSATASYGGVTTNPATAQVTVSTSGYTTISKTADAQYIPDLNGDGKGTGSWTVSLRSFDPTAQSFTDTIDILPYNGDGRGTSFHGTYTLSNVEAMSGATVYYSTADPSTLSDDPAAASNGGRAGSVSGNTVGWSTTYTPNATAIRVIGPQLASGDEQQFHVSIATNGATGGDVYVNRAQARAGHTELVMRTSAPITEAFYYAYTLKKYIQGPDGNWHDANDAGDYPAFHYGDTIHYKEVVTNVGEGTLTNIDVTDDKQPQAGSFHIDTLASGQSQSHEYSITLSDSVSGDVVNTACATAKQPTDMTTPLQQQCDPAGLIVTNYTVVKTSDPAPGSSVAPGQVVKYTVTVTQQGPAPANAMFSDDLSKVLDDATYNNDVTENIGSATYKNGAIGWTGTIPVGGVAKVTYSMTVKDVAGLRKDGDTDLLNVVTSPGCETKADCTVDHKAGYFTYSKVSDPRSGSSVGPGDKVTYTVKIVQHGKGAVANAVVSDDLTKVLDDASYDKDAKASSGRASYAAPTLTWKGDLPVGRTVTVTYSVTVTGKGDLHLSNVVTDGSTGLCDTTIGCRTHHAVGRYIYSKVADPASGSEVQVGDKITYTVTITQQGPGSVRAATVNDNLSKVLDDATYDRDARASAGTLSYAAPRLTWTGDLAVGEKVTMTYSVTVNGKGDQRLANVVTTPDHRGSCDTSVGCRTHHTIGSAPVSTNTTPPAGSQQPPANTADSSQGGGSLAFTGMWLWAELGAALVLLVCGAAVTVLARKRNRSV